MAERKKGRFRRKTSHRGLVIVIILVLVCAAAGWLGWNWYDNNVDRSGWKQMDGKTVYTDFYGDPMTAWQEIDGARYYFGQDGNLRTGWLEMDENRYYLGHDGAVRTGWQKVGGVEYYLDEDGILQSGWLELPEGRYYLTEEGTAATGLQQIGGSLYYLDESGLVTTGWQEIEGSRYYFREDGTAVTGQLSLEEGVYSFRDDGTMHFGWLEGENGTSYYRDDGTMATGLTDIDGKRYYFGEDGAMQLGWVQLGEYSYYFLADGSAAVGPNEIDGQTRYFTPSGIHLYLVNPWNYVPEDYEMELVKLDFGATVDVSCSEALQRMYDDCKAAGLNPLVRSSYRSYMDQYVTHQDRIRRYMEEDGYSYSYAATLAKQSVAVAGTSEHQLGLAVDITDMYQKQLNFSQENTEVAKWLMEHCWEYGFILRYPNGSYEITGIVYEPWHYRYVGVEVAMELKELGITLEEYLDAVHTEE